MSIALAHRHPSLHYAAPVRRRTAHSIPSCTLGAARADRLAMGMAVPLLGAMSLCLWYGIFRLATALIG